MEYFDINNKKLKIHFVGIGGIGMSSLAKYCLKCGFLVSGSDKVSNSKTRELQDLGATVYKFHRKSNIKNVDVVVFSSAIKVCNPEIKHAIKFEIPVLSRTEFLTKISEGFEKMIAISGSHGKTTTTAMLTRIFKYANLSFTYFIGGEDREFDNFYYCGKKYLICEACEYKKNFLSLSPNVAIVQNIDDDHLDYYGNIKNVISAFNTFTVSALTFCNNDDKNCKYLSSSSKFTFGIDNKSDYMAKNIRQNKNGYSFTVYAFNRRLGRINLSVLGKHNIYNALGAIAVSNYYKIPFCCIKMALEGFLGVKRRFEKMGLIFGKCAYADYCHHPTEIKTFLNTLNKKTKKRVVVFQPHTYSRTQILMNSFIDVLKDEECLIIYKTYPARERFKESGCAFFLYQKLKVLMGDKVRYADNLVELGIEVKTHLEDNDCAVFLGAGDIYEDAKVLVDFDG